MKSIILSDTHLFLFTKKTPLFSFPREIPTRVEVQYELLESNLRQSEKICARENHFRYSFPLMPNA